MVLEKVSEFGGSPRVIKVYLVVKYKTILLPGRKILGRAPWSRELYLCPFRLVFHLVNSVALEDKWQSQICHHNFTRFILIKKF